MSKITIDANDLSTFFGVGTPLSGTIRFYNETSASVTFKYKVKIGNIATVESGSITLPAGGSTSVNTWSAATGYPNMPSGGVKIEVWTYVYQ